MKGDCRHRTVPLASFVRHAWGLGARIPSSSCSSVAFAPSPPAFSKSRRFDLVHESPPTLVPPSPLHQVPSPFSKSGRFDLVHESAPPLVLPSPLHQVPTLFPKSTCSDLVHESAPPLIPPSPLHQVPPLFSQPVSPTPYTIEQKCVLKGKFFSGIIERHPKHTIRKEIL